MHDSWRKYRPFPKIDLKDRTWPDNEITQPPIWCSVDLRDGNQALVEPMGLPEKLRLFQLLVEVGFKEIEIAFPSASQTEFDFTRALIEQDLIPDDVTIQVLTQAREHLIRRTFESLQGAKNAIVHLYNSTSTLQREVVFGLDQDAILDLAVKGTRLIKDLVPTLGETNVRFEYSPESFTGTELDYALRVCEAVTDVWEPTVENPIILNLPATVELASPNVYADQIEWMSRHFTRRAETILSVHTHNDRGCAVAAAELSQMAGANRVEGTLFGYGERTGNVDILTLALNLHMQGIDCGLNVTDMPEIMKVLTACTGNPIHPRHPYAGDLVFTAFSGSHQDAISKGMRALADRTDGTFAVPYLTIDPTDIGREYSTIIRVNSQSGKGGVAYILRSEYGIDMPKAMHPEFSVVIQKAAEQSGKEISPAQIYEAFQSTYITQDTPYELVNFSIETDRNNPEQLECKTVVRIDGTAQVLSGYGHGPMEAFAQALRKLLPNFEVLEYHEHSLSYGVTSSAVAFVNVRQDGKSRYGAGMDPNLTRASLLAIVSALNLLYTG